MSNNMDDDNDDKDDTKRKSRNLSEKKRRDQFNMLVNELSSMVSANNRKMDKSTVLKSTISFLKNHNEISVRSRAHEIKEDWKPSFLSNEEFTHLILEALDGFIMVFSSSGKVFYASEGITSLLGHLPSDLLNMSIYDIVYEEDQTTLYNILLNPTAIVEPLQTGINCENQIIFSLHMKRGSFNSQESVCYEPVQFVGYFRLESELDSGSRNNYNSNEPEGRVIFVGTGRLQTPQLIREMSVLDTKSEFTSRHSLEWKFLFLDHRAPPIIGYLPFEVLGTSGYDYYHFDDLDKVVTCHEALMQKGEGTSCFYRFLTKGQQWIWLQTRFYITYHQWNSKPEFVVCTHRVVSHSDVLKHHRGIIGSEEKENEDFAESGSERKHNISVPVTGLSPWSKSSRASKFVSNSSSPRPSKQHRHYRNIGNTSDSTSISADSPNSRYSVVSSFSSRSRARHHNQPLRSSNQSSSYHMSSQPMPQAPPQASYYPSPMVPMTQPLPHHSRDAQGPPPHQMLAPTTFIETAPFVAAIPVQPVIATPAFGPATVIQQIPHSSSHLDYLHSNVILTTPAQNQIQDQLQRKHEELQHLIQQQQDELRRVSEQLMIARYGVIPVGVPYSTSNSPTVVDNRYMGNLTPGNQMANPHLLQPQSLQMMGHSPSASSANHQQQQHQYPIVHHQQHSEQSNSSTDLPPNSEYIQLEMSSGQQQSQQMMMASSSMTGRSSQSDVLQFQMNQEQAQSLFSSGASDQRSVITSVSQNIHQTN